MDGRVAMVTAGVKGRYPNRDDFIDSPITIELIRFLLDGERLGKILHLCAAGVAPLWAVVYDVEKFAENHGVVVNGKLPDEWKKDVGRLIGAIVYFYGYVSDGEDDLQRLPKYFHYAANFRREC